ncbi:MAG: hypothetical protein AAFY36_19080, partial [Bacteroidota bacterium]
MINWNLFLGIVAIVLFYSCNDTNKSSDLNAASSSMMSVEDLGVDSSMLYVESRVVNETDTLKVIQADAYSNVTMFNMDTLF